MIVYLFCLSYDPFKSVFLAMNRDPVRDIKL